MDEEKWTTAQIEAYLRNTLPREKEAQLTAELDENEKLRAEVAAYQQLVNGLDALQERSLRDQMAGWEPEAGLNDTTELIAWYLEGKLGPEGQAQVETRIAKNPAFKEEVEAYRNIIEGMEATQDEHFRSQLQSWEASLASDSTASSSLRVASRRPVWQYAAAAVGALLIAFTTLYLYAQVNYSGPALARQYYQAPLSERTMGEEAPATTALQERMDQAHQQLTGRDYNAAFMAFDSLIREIPRATLDSFNQNLLLEQANWNRLLAATAMDNPPVDVVSEARRISQTPGHEYQAQAKVLLEAIETRWFKWAN
jgi:anti-sigma factor RsiW